MEFKTLSYKYVTVNTDQVSDILLIALENNAALLFELGLNDEKGAVKILKLIYSQKDIGKFSIFLNLQNARDLPAISNNFLEVITVILSHYNYIKYDSRHLIGIQFNSEIEKFGKSEFVRKWFQLFAEQGFEDFYIVDFGNNSPSFTISKSMLFLMDNHTFGDDLLAEYYKLICFSNEVPKLFIHAETKEKVYDIFNLIKNAELQLQEKYPVPYGMRLLSNNNILEICSLNHNNKALKSAVISRSEYIDFLAGKIGTQTEHHGLDISPLAQLKKFYYNEYEILPVWYKRLGHIIKVVMGKRTFVSLFRNDVKKYKD